MSEELLQIDRGQGRELGRWLFPSQNISVSFGFMTIAVLTLATILFGATESFAASGAHHEPSIFDLVPFWVNFLAFLGILYWLLKDPAKAFWSTRRETISESAMRGQREQEAAKARIAVAREKLENLEAESERIRAAIERETDKEVEELRHSGRERLEQLSEQAQQGGDAQRSASHDRLRRELGAQVLALAEEQVRKAVDRSVDRRLREEALDSGVRNLLQS